MGVVYKGYETSLNRYVAIEVSPIRSRTMKGERAFPARGAQHGRAQRSAHHPDLFIGDDEGQTYFVMEFVDSESLGSVLKRERKLNPEQAAKIIYQTAMGLSTAHDRGVIHRDIKPGN